jgi:hypothetical protein
MPTGVYTRTEEGRKNMSLAAKGKKLKPETIAKIAAAHKGSKRSPEFCKQMSEARKGSGNPMYGRKLKPEHIEAIKKSVKEIVWTDEMKERASEIRTEYHKNHPRTDETRKKISEGVRKAHGEGRGKRIYNILKILYIKPQKPKAPKKDRPYKGIPLKPEHREKISKSNIGKKFTDEHKKRLSDSRTGVYVGERCPAWKGGISFEPYCPKFNHHFKNCVREYFNYTCVLCGITSKEIGKQMSVHHVNYEKKALCNEEKPLFVTLCPSCHTRTNHNREYWKDYFIELIDTQYDGKCY